MDGKHNNSIQFSIPDSVAGVDKKQNLSNNPGPFLVFVSFLPGFSGAPSELQMGKSKDFWEIHRKFLGNY